MAIVTIERLPELINKEHHRDSEGIIDTGYCSGCAALPRNYGSPQWEKRPEVITIKTSVFAALDRLDKETGISSRFSGKPVLVKPNLVTVYHRMGLLRETYPETTDPRVLDAVVLWLKNFSADIHIVESSGRGAPTRGSFRVSGIDRLASHRGCRLSALDEMAVDRYILPKAEYHREILIPEVFSQVVRGEAAYVSVPKLKTNLYTDVTLGFKNAMGVIPYNLRQRSHHYAINRKLVEMLYLFKPDMIVIDGVVGGEGECPAPVDPVDSRMIIAGDHPVETDRIATKYMGFDPSKIKLISDADELGFGDPDNVQVLVNGEDAASDFRPADWLLTSKRVREMFPEILTLIGIDRGNLSEAEGPSLVEKMQASCRGGCVATTRFALAMFEAEGIKPRRPVALIIGCGVNREGGPYWYDAEGKAYREEDIKALSMKKAVIGSCSRPLAHLSDRFVEGCMVLPNGPHMVLHSLTGRSCRIMSLRNKNLLTMLAATLEQGTARKRLIRQYRRLDASLRLEDQPVETRDLTDEEAKKDWIEWPMTSPDKKERKKLLDFEDDAAVATFRGIMILQMKERLLWRIKAVITTLITLAPLVLSITTAAQNGNFLGLNHLWWLGFFILIELLHAGELRSSLKENRDYIERRGRKWNTGAVIRTLIATMFCGFPVWIPKKRRVFE